MEQKRWLKDLRGKGWDFPLTFTELKVLKWLADNTDWGTLLVVFSQDEIARDCRISRWHAYYTLVCLTQYGLFKE